MPDNLPLILVVVGVVVVGVVVAVLLRRRGRPEALGTTIAPEPEHRRRAAVIINPTKFTDVAPVRTRITAACAASGWDEPLFLETTAEDPGRGQTRAALEAGVDVVCALGGDGTVRCVAEVLAGTSTPLGLLPSGTGNLLARNMDLPLDNLERAVRTALEGADARVDVGRLEVDGGEGADGAEPARHVFLVMAGMGFDAAIMAGAPEELKARVGWPAYVVSGVRHLRGDRFRVTVTAGEEDPVTFRARTVVIGNCGRLLAGITLMPDARIDDGLLDCVALSPKTLAGWVAVSSRIMRRTTATNPRVDHWAATGFTVRSHEPQIVQLDGDVIGETREIRALVDPGALIVRVPR